jgi:hypothetical protein
MYTLDVTKLPHVSVTCHIEHEEELQLLEHCIQEPSDPRFNEKIHTVYDVVLTKNRDLYLNALVQGEQSALCGTVPRAKDSGWPHRMDMTALSATPEEWRKLSLKYPFKSSHFLSSLLFLLPNVHTRT